MSFSLFYTPSKEVQPLQNFRCMLFITYNVILYDSFILSALDISMLIDLVTLIMLFAYTIMYHLIRIKCIVTYDLYGLISHKGQTITSDVLRTWSPYILNYGQINIMAKKPRLELLSRLRILQNVNEIFDYILSYISCKPRHVYGPFLGF